MLWRLRDSKRRNSEKLLMWFVWRLPKRIVYWSYIRVAAYATQQEEYSSKTPSEISVMDALKAWK